MPLPAAPNHADITNQELTSQLPSSGNTTQGQLFVDVKLVNTIPNAFGYGYGYRGGQGGGTIKFWFRYTPPSIAGEYSAALKVFFEDVERAASTANFVIVKPFASNDVQSRATIYPRSNTEALTRDEVVVRAWVSESVIGNVVSATVDPGLLNANRQQMDRITQFHPAILKKWGIDVNAPKMAT